MSVIVRYSVYTCTLFRLYVYVVPFIRVRWSVSVNVRNSLYTCMLIRIRQCTLFRLYVYVVPCPSRYVILFIRVRCSVYTCTLIRIRQCTLFRLYVYVDPCPSLYVIPFIRVRCSVSVTVRYSVYTCTLIRVRHISAGNHWITCFFSKREAPVVRCEAPVLLPLAEHLACLPAVGGFQFGQMPNFFLFLAGREAPVVRRAVGELYVRARSACVIVRRRRVSVRPKAERFVRRRRALCPDAKRPWSDAKRLCYCLPYVWC